MSGIDPTRFVLEARNSWREDESDSPTGNVQVGKGISFMLKVWRFGRPTRKVEGSLVKEFPSM